MTVINYSTVVVWRQTRHSTVVSGSHIVILWLRVWVELKRHRINAVAEAGRPRSIIKNMTKMCVATTASHFGSSHSRWQIDYCSDFCICRWFEKTWPASSGIKFGAGLKEFVVTTDASVSTILIAVVVLATKWRLGASLATYVILLISKISTPFCIRFFYWFRHRYLIGNLGLPRQDQVS